LLTHPTLDLLHELGLAGMAKAFAEIEASAEATALSHPEWLALLLDRELSHRRDPGDIISECPGDFVGIRTPSMPDLHISRTPTIDKGDCKEC
jgi:hypothetical protein